jgi:hypothetical protein
VTLFTPAVAIRLMDEGGVDTAVIHPPALGRNANALAPQAVRDYPGRFAIMGTAEWQLRDDCVEKLRKPIFAG